MPKDLTLYERIRGKRTSDIVLPNESGRVDPRLKRPRGIDLLKRAVSLGSTLPDRSLRGGKR